MSRYSPIVRRKLDRRRFLIGAGKAALGATTMGHLGVAASAQEKFPAREVVWIIYQAPGGSIDTTARVIQPYLEKQGVKTTLEYALGAGGRVARSKLHSARPDGYMMMTESAPGGAIDEVIGRAGYKASEFIPVYGWSVLSWQLCVKKDSPIRTFQQFIDECKKRRVVVGTIGRGGSSHIQIAALQKELGLQFGLVHFDGSGKAYPAVMGGHVDVAISGPASGSRMRDSLHFLGVTGAEREKALPDVPTLTEQGFRVTPIDQIWYAMTTPKVPDDRIAVLTNAFAKAFEDKMLWEQMNKVGEYPKLLARPQIEEMVKRQAEVIEKYKALGVTTGNGAKFDLVVRRGTLVIPGLGTVVADIGTAGGKITALGDDLSAPAEDVLDARGKVVLPGIFDPHVHIGNELAFEVEAETETRAAVLGGVTTIGIFLRSLDDSYFDHLPAFRRAMDERSYVDSVFHPQIFTEQQIAELPGYAEQFGIRSFKFYMSGIPGIVKSVSDEVLLEGFRQVASLGADAIACVHCETGALIDAARAELKRRKPEGTLADWEDAHPAEAEALAIQTAAYLARLAGAHLYVVHLSSRQGLDVVRACRSAGARLTVETTSPYLGISSDDPNGFLAKMVPPVRPPEHGLALWEGVRDGSIQTLGTDNTSRARKSKQPQAGLHGSRPGLPVLGTHLPALLHFGRLRGVPLERIVDCTTRAPAQVYGIYPRKGTIAVGSDADLVVVDLDAERVVRAEDLQGMSDFSPFEGKRLRGWPVATVKGGKIAARDGKITAPPIGRYIPRSAPRQRASEDWSRLVSDSMQ